MLQEQTLWIIVVEILYLLLLGFTCLRIVFDTRSVSKTLAYLLFAVFVPIVGVVFYFSFGINYRKRKIYDKKLNVDENFKKEINELLKAHDLEEAIHNDTVLVRFELLIKLLANKKSGGAFLLPNNNIRLLFNGENKFSELIKDLQQAKHHIHIEYYIYENDRIGNTIKEILKAKAKEGVKVRVIYDDFGSKGIRRNIARELNESGVEAFPFNKIKLLLLANRLNYRNHRKIVIVDGIIAFTGGINISDKYINDESQTIFWRDTHVRINGAGVFALQQIFISDWNFCSGQRLRVAGNNYFPFKNMETYGNAKLQVVSSGPDSDRPNILFAILKAIQTAKSEILLTTPYYIPDESLQQTLVMTALSGVEVKLLVPKEGDSKLVDSVSRIYFEELLQAGVKIYLYEKGFIHAKTLVIDGMLASVGTANLDLRSFDLNFEVAALIYDKEIAEQLKNAFYDDLKQTKQLFYTSWVKRSLGRKFLEQVLRLISPFM
ncbi:cardiolipin synthase [Pedobacter sp.]